METFDRENIDKLLEIRQIGQYFPQSKFSAVRYIMKCRKLVKRLSKVSAIVQTTKQH